MSGKQSNLSRYFLRALMGATVACLAILAAGAIWARLNRHSYVALYRFVPARAPVTAQMLEEASRVVAARLAVLEGKYRLNGCRADPVPKDNIRVSFQTQLNPATALRWATMTGQSEFCLLHPDAALLEAAEPEELPEQYCVKVYKEQRYALSKPGEMVEREHRYLVSRKPLLRVTRFAGVHFATAGMKRETVLTFEFEKEQAEEFEALTALNTGRQMAMLIDGELFFPPKQIASAIGGGVVQIRGYFYNPPLRTLIAMLDEGTLPGTLEQVSLEADR